MTRNLAIATIFLFATTLLLGYIWVREHYVLDERTQRFEGALVARGARDYEQYCASCHGLTGEGGAASGAPQINNLPTTLQEAGRLDGPTGVTAKYGTVRNFVESTITSGVRGTAMPRWSARLGGPLRDDQIKDLAAYISNWWADPGNPNPNVSTDAAQVAADFKATAQAQALAAAAANTPQARGQALFAANGCNACHNLNDKDSAIPAPGLGGLFGPDGTASWGTVLPSGQEVSVDSLKDWIKGGSVGHTNPRPPLNPGFGPYQPIMPGFAQITDEQLNDMIAYMSTFDRAGEQTLPSLGPDGQPLPEQPAGTPTADGAQPTAPSDAGATATPAP